MNTAHPLQEADGTTYNLGSRFGASSSYIIFRAPPAKEGRSPINLFRSRLTRNLPIQYTHSYVYEYMNINFLNHKLYYLLNSIYLLNNRYVSLVCLTGDEDPLNKAEIFSRIPAHNSTKPSYYHSFAMSENYLIVIEQPLYLKLKSLVSARFKLNTRGFTDSLEWEGDGVVRKTNINKC